jgi:hypothetical protein
MPRVTHVKAARKDNPVCKKGESYYWWKFRYGGKRYSLTRPRPSQLTNSAYYGTVRSLVEQVEDASPEDYDGFIALRDEIGCALEELGQETQDSLDNMPDALQYSPTGELLQNRIDACESGQSDAECVEPEDEDEPTEDEFSSEEDCTTCEGRGHVDEDDEMDHCADCNGEGTIEEEGGDDYENALEEWRVSQHDSVEGAMSELMDAVSNCEV